MNPLFIYFLFTFLRHFMNTAALTHTIQTARAGKFGEILKTLVFIDQAGGNSLTVVHGRLSGIKLKLLAKDFVQVFEGDSLKPTLEYNHLAQSNVKKCMAKVIQDFRALGYSLSASGYPASAF
jgi:hypothetical protein